MDSDCSFYTTPNMKFTTYHCMDNSEVQLENNDEVDVVGVGNIRFKVSDIIWRTLIGEMHVPKLKKNLMSLSVVN